MGTRSRIGVMHGDKCKSVYCHWDGYLSHNGRILQDWFDSAKANHLVSLGDMSSLRPEIGEKHSFSQFELPAQEREAFEKLTENWCTFYGRDRGETNADFQVDENFESFTDRVSGCSAEYFYIMKDGVWYCGVDYPRECMVPGQLYILAEQLAKVTA
jgi:hypothetical protein